MAADGWQMAVDNGRRQVALGDDRGILVFLSWHTFPSHGNVGFLWGDENVFWLIFLLDSAILLRLLFQISY